MSEGARAAFAVEKSQNAKIGECSCTYVSQASCPVHCPFKDDGCYAQRGNTNIHTLRVNASETTEPEAIARVEAEAIDGLSGKRPLRLKVVGDCPTPGAAAIVASAAERYKARGGQPIWAYTHAWRDVERSWHGPAVSILGSCESMSEFANVRAQGYAPALVVPAHPADGKRWTAPDGTGVIPCPAQTRKAKGVQCVSCQLCWKGDELLARGLAIAFEPDKGTDKRVVKHLS